MFMYLLIIDIERQPLNCTARGFPIVLELASAHYFFLSHTAIGAVLVRESFNKPVPPTMCPVDQ